jgi:signal transduction histidine kinase
MFSRLFIGPAILGPVLLLTLLLVLGQQVVGQPAAAQLVGADSADEGPALQIHGFGPDLSITSRPVFHLDPAARSWLNIDMQPGPDPGQVRQAVFDLSYDSFKTRLFRDPRAGTFWIRFGVRNNSDGTLPVDIYTATLNYTDCWWVPAGQADSLATSRAVQHTSGGTLRSPLPGRSLIDRQYNILTLNIPPHGSGEIFLALRQKTSVFDFNGVHLFTPAALGSAFSTDYQDGYALLVFQWLFQGFLLCQILYMLFQWLIIRRKEYLYYLAYMAVIALYFLSKFESDLGLDLLFTRYPELKVYLSKTMLILPYFLYFRFVRHFLEIPGNFPGLNKWIVRIEYFLLVYLVADLAFILLTFDQGLQTTVFTFILLLVFAAAASFIFYLFRRRQALIYYVLTGSLFVGIGNILGQVLTYFQDYHHLHLFTNILLFPQAGVLLEILCFTAGLGYKSHMWEKEKIRSQERLIEQLKANELLQSRMQHIRNKIAQDLHDDIGSTLSSISILSDLAMKENSSSQTMETMHEIKDSSILLMEKMDDIVWSINPRNDSLEHLLIRVRHFATTLFEAKDIDYRIEIQKNINEVLLPVDCRQHIYLILKESINNLVKYARATQATIEVQFDRQHLQLCVRDNGCGFNIAGPSTGNGLSGMQRRAAMMNAQLRIKTAPGEGTEIGLRVEIG